MTALHVHDPASPGDESVVVLTLHGDLDLVTAGTIAALTAGVELGPGTRLVLDIADVPLMDSTGLRALLVLQREAAAAGATVALRGITHQVLDLLLLTGLDALFPIEPEPVSGPARVERS